MVLTDEGRLKVTDFGIARAANTQQMTEVGSIVGTAQYLSPEQARGLAVGPESDIYSMGVVLYEMLCGDLPFTGESAVDIAMKQVSDTPPPLNRRNRLVSPAMEQVVMRALAKDPALRFSSAEQMSEELARVSRGQSASADTQQATRVIAAGEATRVIGGRPRVRRASCAAPAASPPERPAPRRSAWPWCRPRPARPGGRGRVRRLLDALRQRQDRSAVGHRADLQAGDGDTEGRRAQGPLRHREVERRRHPQGGQHRPVGRLRRGERLHGGLKVGIGPTRSTVPQVKGLSQTDATNLLVSRGFKVATPVIVNSPLAALGFVIGSTPKEGTPQKLNTVVTLKVASGSVQIPTSAGRTAPRRPSNSRS